jgi:hypothetical protein
LIVPFVPIAPPAQHLRGVPACVGSQLHPVVTLQGATGSELGGILLRNVGRKPCVLRTPLRIVRFDRAGRKLPFTSRYGDGGLGYTALRIEPRHAATIGAQLFNACSSTPSELWLDRPRLDLHIAPQGRCDGPTEPPDAEADDLDSADEGHAAHVLRVISVDAPSQARAGRVLRYTVTLANPTGHAWRGAPLYGEELFLDKANIAVTRQYALRTRTYAPHSRTTFEMRLRLPAPRDRGAYIEWSLLDRTEPIRPTVKLNMLLSSWIDLASFSLARASVRIS